MRLIILCSILFFVNISAAYTKTVQEGLALYRLGSYSKAETVFREILEKTPDDYTSQYMLAVTLVNLKKYNEANKLYKNIIASSENDRLVSLSRVGIRNLASYSSEEVFSGAEVTRAVLNVNINGGVIIVNDVILNNTVKTKFIFDTGATYTTISKEAAAKLNISTSGAQTIKIMTGSGYIDAPLVTIPVVEVNGLVVRDVKAIVADLPVHTTGENPVGLTGLLGLSFLENFMVTVDRSKNLVILEKTSKS